MAIYVSTRESKDDKWPRPAQLHTSISSEFAYEPTVSADGRTIIFTSNRAPSNGIFDLWMSTRKSPKDSWSKPIHMCDAINENEWQGSPRLFGEEFGSTLVFHSSNGAKIASRSSGKDPFVVAKRFVEDHQVESVYSPFALNDGTTLYYRRPTGETGSQDIWVVRRVKKAEAEPPVEAETND